MPLRSRRILTMVLSFAVGIAFLVAGYEQMIYQKMMDQAYAGFFLEPAMKQPDPIGAQMGWEKMGTLYYTDRFKIEFNAGVAALAWHSLDQSGAHFIRALTETDDKMQKSEAFYGMSWIPLINYIYTFGLERFLPEAFMNYGLAALGGLRESLMQNPDNNIDASRNYEIIKRIVDRQQKKQQEEEQAKPKQNTRPGKGTEPPRP